MNGAAAASSTQLDGMPSRILSLQEHLLEVGVGGLEALLAADRELAALDAGHVLLGRAGVPPAMVLAVGVRAGAQSQVRPALPVPEVVPALEPRLRPVRDLVVAVAGLAEDLARHGEHVGLEVGIGLGRRRRSATARPSGVAGSIVSA